MLSQHLQSGNLTGAQSDFATLQQDLQQAGGAQGHPHHHHHHASSAQSSQSDSSGSTINQSLAALGQALQTGNLQAAQQSLRTLARKPWPHSAPGLAHPPRQPGKSHVSSPKPCRYPQPPQISKDSA
jgi:hypothetical protein